MNRPSKEDGHVRMPEEEFEELLALAAERGAKRALADVGLVDEQAADDVRDYAKPTVMRSRGREVQVVTGFDDPKRFA